MRASLLLLVVGLVAEVYAVAWSDAPAAPFQVDDSTLGLWHFDEGQGETSADAGPLGVAAALDGCEWSPHGRFSGCLRFNGAGQAVIPFREDFRMGAEGCLEAWFKPDEGRSAERPAYVIGTEADDSTRGIGIASKPEIGWMVEIESQSGTLRLRAGTELSPEWHHVAFSWDVDGRYLYLDEQLAEESADIEPILPFESPIFIGNELNRSYNFTGLIDEVRYSKVARKYAPSKIRSLREQLEATEPVNIGTDKQLLIDDALIDARQDVRIVTNPMMQYREPVIAADKEWESLGVWPWVCVWEEDGNIRLYYESWSKVETSPSYNLCYAESDDGIHFVKPNLGLVEWEGSTENNIVFNDDYAQGFIFRDPNPDTPPEELYKIFYLRRSDYGLFVATSPDGFHFTRKPSMLIKWEGHLDTQNALLWDDEQGRYVAYLRANVNGRRVGRCVSDDLKSFTEPEVVFGADDRDPPNMDVYNPCPIKYPWAKSVYFLFPSPFYHYSDSLDVQVATSRDGITWFRPEDRAPVLRRGPEHDWDGREIFMGVGMIRRGDEIWMYYGGLDLGHTDVATRHPEGYQGGIGRAITRLDGFVCLAAPHSGGRCITKPLVFSGSRLELNMDGSAGGSVIVRFLDEAGQPLEGWVASDKLMGNYVSGTVTFGGDPDVSALAGRLLRLQFNLRDAKLFAFQFVQ